MSWWGRHKPKVPSLAAGIADLVLGIPLQDDAPIDETKLDFCYVSGRVIGTWALLIELL